MVDPVRRNMYIVSEHMPATLPSRPAIPHVKSPTPPLNKSNGDGSIEPYVEDV